MLSIAIYNIYPKNIIAQRKYSWYNNRHNNLANSLLQTLCLLVEQSILTLEPFLSYYNLFLCSRNKKFFYIEGHTNLIIYIFTKNVYDF